MALAAIKQIMLALSLAELQLEGPHKVPKAVS